MAAEAAAVPSSHLLLHLHDKSDEACCRATYAQGEEELHLIQVPSARALSVWQNLHGQHSHTHLPGHQRSPTFKEGLIMEAGTRNMD